MGDKIVLGIIGGCLLAYGYMQKNKKVKHDQFMDVPDPSTQTEGNICLVLGVVAILGTLLA
jgi:xanthine/uracil permease